MRTRGDVAAGGADAAKAAPGRRRAVAGVVATALAVAAVIGGGTALFSRGGADVVPADAAPADPHPATQVPDGRRLVGIGHAAIAVPQGWGTNEDRCGTPQADTVVIDVGVVASCAAPRPVGVESVEVRHGRPLWQDGATVAPTEVAGEPAERWATVCIDPYGGTSVCRGAVYLPGRHVSFLAESSSASGAAEVEEILRWVRIVDDLVAVPGYRELLPEEQRNQQAAYAAALEEAGLEARIRTERKPGLPGGIVLDVTPGPGTMLSPGATVDMLVTAPPDGPADEVRVGMNSQDADGTYGRDLDDAEIRAGATMTLGVGDRVWAYASGNREETLAADADGSSLVPSAWAQDPNKGHSWTAARPGTTRVTLTITADGRRIPLGTVTVVATG